jgi:hypothetical protein
LSDYLLEAEAGNDDTLGVGDLLGDRVVDEARAAPEEKPARLAGRGIRT